MIGVLCADVSKERTVFIFDVNSPRVEVSEVHRTHLSYRVIRSVLDPRKCEYIKDYSLDFEHAYMTTYFAS